MTKKIKFLNQQAKKLHEKADEFQKQHDLAVADEIEIRDQLTQAKETIKDLEETALLNALRNSTLRKDGVLIKAS